MVETVNNFWFLCFIIKFQTVPNSYKTILCSIRCCKTISIEKIKQKYRIVKCSKNIKIVNYKIQMQIINFKSINIILKLFIVLNK